MNERLKYFICGPSFVGVSIYMMQKFDIYERPLDANYLANIEASCLRCLVEL